MTSFRDNELEDAELDLEEAKDELSRLDPAHPEFAANRRWLREQILDLEERIDELRSEMAS